MAATTYKVPVVSLKIVRERTITLPRERCGDSSDASAVLQALVGAKPTEHLAAVFMNAAGTIIGTHVIAMGGISSCPVMARDVFRAAIVAGASAIVLGHNHPSGNATPSVEDMKVTADLVEAGRTLGLPIIDHVIVTAYGGSYSMQDRGTLPS